MWSSIASLAFSKLLGELFSFVALVPQDIFFCGKSDKK